MIGFALWWSTVLITALGVIGPQEWDGLIGIGIILWCIIGPALVY